MGVLERYRYTIVAVGIGMTVLPRVPGIGEEVNGAYLNVHVGSISFQPAELAKIALVIFLASYLRDNRQILVTAGRRVLGVTLPPMKQFGPMLVVWGAAMATLLVTRELGTSLMFFGAFLALLYVATGRLSFPLIGFVLFAARRMAAGDSRQPRARTGARLGTPLRDSPLRTEVRRQLPARAVAVRAGRRRAAGYRLRPLAAWTSSAGPRKRHDLRGDRQRARPRRRGGTAAHLPAVRRTGPEDRDARARLLLQAAGDRSSPSSWRCRCS